MTTLGVHSATRTAHVSQQELQHRPGPDQLTAGRMLRQPDGIDDRHHLVGLAHLADQLRDPHELVLRDPSDARHHLRGVARVMLLHQLEDGLRILQRHVALGDAVRGAVGRQPGRRGGGGGRVVDLVTPARDVVLSVGGVIAAEQAVRERVGLLDQEGGIRVVAHVLVVEQVVLQHVIDEPAEVGHVRADPNPGIDIGERGRPGEARVSVDHLGAAA